MQPSVQSDLDTRGGGLRAGTAAGEHEGRDDEEQDAERTVARTAVGAAQAFRPQVTQNFHPDSISALQPGQRLTRRFCPQDGQNLVVRPLGSA